MPPYLISFNGVDNVGKTTQIDLLPSHHTIRKGADLRDPDTSGQSMHVYLTTQYWLWKGSSEEFVCSIVRSLNERHREWTSDQTGKVTIYDRDTAMFEAVAVAVIAMKDPKHDLVEAREKLQAILRERNLSFPPREYFTILFKHGGSLEGSLQVTANREGRDPDHPDERFMLFQRLLYSEMQRQETLEAYEHVIRIPQASSIRGVQDELRMVLLQRTGNELFAPYSGRNVEASFVHFNEIVGKRLEGDICVSPEKKQALIFVHVLESLSNQHDQLKLIAINCMDRYSVATWLKQWLGDKLQIIHVFTGVEEMSDPFDTAAAGTQGTKAWFKSLGEALKSFTSRAALVLDFSDASTDSADTMSTL